MNGACNSTYFGPTPCGPGEGSKGQISLNFIYSQFQRFFFQTFCVFSQIKDIKHVTQDFHSITGVGLGDAGGGGSRFIFPNIVMWHIKLKVMNETVCK